MVWLVEALEFLDFSALESCDLLKIMGDPEQRHQGQITNVTFAKNSLSRKMNIVLEYVTKASHQATAGVAFY